MKKDLGAKVLLYPEPVMVIGTYDEDGETPNAMDVAWGGQSWSRQVSLNISMRHKTTDNIKLHREFTLMPADTAHITETDYLGIVSGKKVPDKIARAGLHTQRSAAVNAPEIIEYPLVMACKVVEMREEFDHLHIVADVVAAHADESILDDDGHVDVAKLRPLSYSEDPLQYHALDGRGLGRVYTVGKALAK